MRECLQNTKKKHSYTQRENFKSENVVAFPSKRLRSVGVKLEAKIAPANPKNYISLPRKH